MRILISHNSVIRKFIVLETGDRDGSLIMTIRRGGHSHSRTSWSMGPDGDGPRTIDFDESKDKNKKITIHQSGRVNYHQNRSSIFIAPLTQTTMSYQIYGYRVPALDKLDVHDQEVAAEDLIIELSGPQEGAVSFSVFVGPASFEPLAPAIKLLYEAEGYAVSVQIDPVAFSVPEGLEDQFTTLIPKAGLFASQQMEEDQAMVAWHQALTGSSGPILYEPNGEGVIRIIFGVQMRVAPRFTVELADPELYVSDQDVKRDDRSDKVMLKFRVRRRKSGELVRQAVEIRTIELDAEL